MVHHGSMGAKRCSWYSMTLQSVRAARFLQVLGGHKFTKSWTRCFTPDQINTKSTKPQAFCCKISWSYLVLSVAAKDLHHPSAADLHLDACQLQHVPRALYSASPHQLRPLCEQLLCYKNQHVSSHIFTPYFSGLSWSCVTIVVIVCLQVEQRSAHLDFWTAHNKFDSNMMSEHENDMSCCPHEATSQIAGDIDMASLLALRIANCNCNRSLQKATLSQRLLWNSGFLGKWEGQKGNELIGTNALFCCDDPQNSAIAVVKATKAKEKLSMAGSPCRVSKKAVSFQDLHFHTIYL